MDGQQTREIAPGVRGYTESGDWGTAIYEWAGDGKGNTRAALRSLRRPITVIDPGEPGTESYAYWQKMLGQGLVDHVRDDEDNDITEQMRQAAAADPAFPREMLEVMAGAKLCGPLLKQACGEGRLQMLHSIDQTVGREQFRQWLMEIDGTPNGPLVAAAVGWHPEVFRFLVDVLGGVPFKMSEKFSDRFTFEPTPAVECRALEAALGMDAVFSPHTEPFPLHSIQSCVPCAPIVRMILDVVPQIRPQTLLARPMRADANSAGTHLSLVGWSIRAHDPSLQELLMSRKPVVTQADLIAAIERGNVPVVRSMLTHLKVMPRNALVALRDRPHAQQVEMLLGAPKMLVDPELRLADVTGNYAPETYRALCKTFGVNRQLALLGAACAASPEGVRQVARCGAKLDARYFDTSSDAELGPALHLARDGDTVRALVECGASTEATNRHGETPLQSWLGDTVVATRASLLADKILRIAEAGADLAVKSGDKTLMRMAYRWPEEVRRALKSAKMGVKLGTAMSAGPGDDVAPAACAGSDPSPL